MLKLTSSLKVLAALVGGAAATQACATTDDAVPFGFDASVRENNFPGGGATSVGGNVGVGVGAGGSGTGAGTSSGGTCKPAFCPSASTGTGTPCCTSGDTCGVDFGMGCTTMPKDAGLASGGARAVGSGGSSFGSGGSLGNAGSLGNGGSVNAGGAPASGGAVGTGGKAATGGGPPAPVTDAAVPGH